MPEKIEKELIDQHALERAEQQLVGFNHRNMGGDLYSLILAMGLAPYEWKEMQNIFEMTYLTDEEKELIDKAVWD